FEPLDDAVGRVGRVHPDDDVEQREDDEDEQRAEVPEAAPPRHLYVPPGDERSEGNDQAEQPRVALAVAPGGGVQLDVIPMVVMVVMLVLVESVLRGRLHGPPCQILRLRPGDLHRTALCKPVQQILSPCSGSRLPVGETGTYRRFLPPER